MKIITLQKLGISNFMGIRSLEFSPMGKNATLRGDNGTFKTTNASAFSWLLFDKDIHGNSTGNFSIKTTDENDEVIPNIDHSVTGILDVDGIPLTLQKVYREKWLKKRKVLTGHTTEYLIDEVPILKKDYDKQMMEIIPEETFRLLTDINYFNSEKFGWQNRRKILFQLCEGLSEEALDAAEKAKKILASKKKKINEKKDGIQPRIDEKNRDLAAIADYNKAEIQARITELDKQIQDIKTDSTRATLLKEQAELETKLSQIRASQAADRLTATNGLRAKVEKIEDDYAKTKRIISDTEYEILSQGGIAETAEEDLIRMRSEFDRTVADQNTGVEDICYACKQPIPQDQRDATLAAFNLNKSEKLEKINRLGKIAKGKKETAKAAKAKLEEDLKIEKADIIKIEESLRKKKTELENILSPAEKPKGCKDIEITQGKIDKLTNDIQLGDQEADTSSLEYALKIEMAKMAKVDAGEEHKIRIVELGEQEKSLSAEIERLEADLFKAEENTQEQARLLEVPINAKFELVKFQLFEKQMNLGIRPCCKTLVDGIEYSHGLNTGSEIEADCEIVAVLQKHFGISCPVFLDHKESVTKDIKMPCQLISLIVDPKYKELHIIIDE